MPLLSPPYWIFTSESRTIPQPLMAEMSDNEGDFDMDTIDAPEGEPILASVVDDYTVKDSHFDQGLPGRVWYLRVYL